SSTFLVSTVMKTLLQYYGLCSSKLPAFDPELAKALNEGMYHITVIVPAIRASLKNLPIGDAFFIIKYLETVFELMYAECSRLICSPQKKTDDKIKLWRETNDGLYWKMCWEADLGTRNQFLPQDTIYVYVTTATEYLTKRANAANDPALIIDGKTLAKIFDYPGELIHDVQPASKKQRITEKEDGKTGFVADGVAG
ncbi:6716_t:CDS:2, partial [Paraglomus occultum]